MSLKLNVEVSRVPASSASINHHYHRCHVVSCLRDNMGNESNIKILPCPCAEVFYCGCVYSSFLFVILVGKISIAKSVRPKIGNGINRNAMTDCAAKGGGGQWTMRLSSC